MLQIQLKAVYSELADPAVVAESGLAEWLPGGAGGSPWRLSCHQLATYRALTRPGGPEVIFNTAMTGDGKSLAGQLPSLVQGWRHKLFAMYPTNELIRDQLRQTQQTWALWGQTPVVAALDSDVLDRRMAGGDFAQRGQALQALLNNHDVVLTNPDIFYYVMHLFYVRTGKSGDAPDRLLGPLVQAFQQFTFDEFHIFDAPQIVGVVNALLLIDEMTRGQRRQFLFQSATPRPLLQESLRRAGFAVEVIDGSYCHGAPPADPTRWRQILHEVQLQICPDNVEAWVDQHLHDRLLPFFLEHAPQAKGAVIVNSVAQAKRLVERLQGEFARHGLTVGENTGLTSRTQRSRSYGCDLLIGTSTVDIGIDFQINFLLFESRDAGTFVQRLGRVGRHAGYVREGKTIFFGGHFVAYALVPPWIYETLAVGRSDAPPLLQPGAVLDRAEFNQTIQMAYPPTASFDAYARDWGAYQSYRIVNALSNPLVRGQYAEVRNRLLARYKETFRTSILQKAQRYWDLCKHQGPLYEEITAFRGGSYFECGVLDETEQGGDQIKRYDLFALLANARLAALQPDEFRAFVEEHGGAWSNLKGLVAYFRLQGFLPERTQYKVLLQQEVSDWDGTRFGTVQVLQGVQIQAAFPQQIPGYNAINRQLARRKVPAVVCLHHPLQLKRRLRLPLLFPVHPFVSLDGMEGAIVFGREALLLHTALKQSRLNCSGSDTALIL
ncbi:MAG: type I-D CRISPR-associated helicase Cas3' [Caldilinea sp.]|nr:type I-D CRISPR-associated helicase Cas3' [Caldilinea sp.]